MGSLQKNVRDCGVNFSKIISNTHISATLYFWSVLKFLKSFITSRKFYESWIDLRKGEKFSPTCADFACCSRSMWQNSLAVVKSRRWVKALKRLKKESQWSCSEVLSHSLCHRSLHLMLFSLLLLLGLHQAVCSTQSELFFRLLLKNTVRGVQIAAYPNFLAASHEAHK